MRILINGVAALRPKTGIGHYIESLYQQLENSADTRVKLFPGNLAKRFAQRVLRGARGVPSASTSRPRLFAASLTSHSARAVQRLGSVLFRRAFREVAKRVGPETLYHEPNYVPWDADLPTLATIHDLSVLLYPEWHPAERVKYFEKHFFRGLTRCRHLIADSDAIRRQMVNTLGISPERVTTVHLGVRPDFQPLGPEAVLPVLKRLEIAPGYLLHVGTLEPRKNLLRLMQAYCRLERPLRESHPLLLVGGWGWRNEEIRAFYETTARHAGVRKLGYVPDRDLPALYNGARALVFPTHYEGFGFPPLEMMACGGAVLASTADSVREILPGDYPLTAPADTDGWIDAMHNVMIDDHWWNALRARGRQHAARFTWENCARKTQDVYRTIVGARQRLAA